MALAEEANQFAAFLDKACADHADLRRENRVTAGVQEPGRTRALSSGAGAGRRGRAAR